MFLLLSFVKVIELVMREFVSGRGGFSLPASGRLKSPLPKEVKSFLLSETNWEKKENKYQTRSRIKSI
jgi:hypothetical protein